VFEIIAGCIPVNLNNPAHCEPIRTGQPFFLCRDKKGAASLLRTTFGAVGRLFCDRFQNDAPHPSVVSVERVESRVRCFRQRQYDDR
jgi:hypothetical protein